MSEMVKMIRMVRRNFKETDFTKYKPSNWDMTKIVYPWRVMFHPASVFNDIKYENRGSLALANLLFLGLIFSSLLSTAATGFIFNMNRPEDFRLLREIGVAALLPVLWCVANLSMTTLFEGEGNLKEIWIVTNYAFFPYLLITVPVTIISNAITIEEFALASIVGTVATVYSVILLLVGMMTIHQFSLKRTIAMSLVSLGIMACIVFILVLLFSMFGQMIAFFDTVIREITYRK